jgi:putative two-component system response regulator
LARILVADDEPLIVELFTTLLAAQGHHCARAYDTWSVRRELGSSHYDLVLCDVHMPGGSGLELVEWIVGEYPETATMIVSGSEEGDVWQRALAIGTFGYLTTPVRESALLIGVANALRRRELEIAARQRERDLADTVGRRTRALGSAILKLQEAQSRLSAMHEETVRRLALAAEYRDAATGAHIERMSRYCTVLAGHLGLDRQLRDGIRLASLLHDVGKIAIPDAVLLKPGPLDDDEWAMIRTHPDLGHRLLRDSGSDLLGLAASIALTHHERMDGSGYPRGLTGTRIPLEGRIAAVADALDAITSPRVYRRARPLEEALDELESGRGTLFDSDVLDALADARGQVEAIVSEAGVA